MRVAIIGGGPGGLMTAYLLERKSSVRLRVTLFEASDRIGGKLLTARFDSTGALFEAGAAELYGYNQIGPDPLYNLITNLDLTTRKMSGKTVVLGNQILSSPDDIKSRLGSKCLRAKNNFHRQGRRLISPIEYYNAGWPQDNKHPWARRSFESVLAKVPDKKARTYLNVAVHSDLATEPRRTSALFGLQNALIDHQDYVRLYSIEGGMCRVTSALAQNNSANIAINCPVVRVRKNRFSTYDVYFERNGATACEEYDAVIASLPCAWIPSVEWQGKPLSQAMRDHVAYYDGAAHYLRISILFKKPFWREFINGSYFQSDAFGGCCVYDEGTKLDAGEQGVLSWLLAGDEAVRRSNFEDPALIKQALCRLPDALSAGRELFIECKIHRWLGAVSAPRTGHRIRGARARHIPEPKTNPGLLVVGDYLFDTTLNGVLDSADIASDLVLRFLRVKNKTFSPSSPYFGWQAQHQSRLKPSYFTYYDGKRPYAASFTRYFDPKHIIKLIRLVWGLQPPYRLLDCGSASGAALDAFTKYGVEAWGVENNRYIHQKTPEHLLKYNVLADVRDMPFGENYFDILYDTALCYLPLCDVDAAIRELNRVSRHGVFFGSVTSDVRSSIVVKEELADGVQIWGSLAEWSERFTRNGFKLAIHDKETLRRIWIRENDAGDTGLWYPTREAFQYVFYTKDDTAVFRENKVTENGARASVVSS